MICIPENVFIFGDAVHKGPFCAIKFFTYVINQTLYLCY